jgi:hypothetical protein
VLRRRGGLYSCLGGIYSELLSHERSSRPWFVSIVQRQRLLLALLT